MWNPTRREFLGSAALAAAAISTSIPLNRAHAYVPAASEVPPGDRPAQDKSVAVLHPRGRVPVSLIIDDSTCLVNMGAFCMPQFRAAYPQNPAYWKDWKKWPREIPDDFMREFAHFSIQQGVRGKFSVVPYPACVGWLDRELPGWTKKELQESLRTIRELIATQFDLTPEMISHTRVIDIKTGRPLAEANAKTMEISYPPARQSADELAAYIAYALGILKNADLPCTGVTTPGGFGNACKSELSLAMRQALAEVFPGEIPFYFKYIATDSDRTHPRLEHVKGIIDADAKVTPQLIVNVPAATGDWFGNWDGDQPPQGEKYLNDDGTTGRMAELIQRGEPAVMFGHWAGLYSNGSGRGFNALKKAVLTLNRQFADQAIWMKSSEMARYWAARELTRIDRSGNQIALAAPFACPSYTLRIDLATGIAPTVVRDQNVIALKEVSAVHRLTPGTWVAEKSAVVVCFDLQKGSVRLTV
jgi:hypothetical protein